MANEDYLANLDEPRRKALAESLQPITVAELEKLGETLFPYSDHPWRDTFFNFIKDNATANYHHAQAGKEFHVVYCTDKNKGVWYIPGRGVGPLQERGCTVMKELVGGSK